MPRVLDITIYVYQWKELNNYIVNHAELKGQHGALNLRSHFGTC